MACIFRLCRLCSSKCSRYTPMRVNVFRHWCGLRQGGIGRLSRRVCIASAVCSYPSSCTAAGLSETTQGSPHWVECASVATNPLKQGTSAPTFCTGSTMQFDGNQSVDYELGAPKLSTSNFQHSTHTLPFFTCVWIHIVAATPPSPQKRPARAFCGSSGM